MTEQDHEQIDYANPSQVLQGKLQIMGARFEQSPEPTLPEETINAWKNKEAQDKESLLNRIDLLRQQLTELGINTATNKQMLADFTAEVDNDALSLPAAWSKFMAISQQLSPRALEITNSKESRLGSLLRRLTAAFARKQPQSQPRL